MDIKIIISADDSALEFSRNLGKLIGQYISQADIEAGLAGKVITATIEPDTLPWEDKVEKGLQYADQAQAAGEAVAKAAIENHEQEIKAAPAMDHVSAEELRAAGMAFAKTHGKEAMRGILDKLKVKKLSDLDDKGRATAMELIKGGELMPDKHAAVTASGSHRWLNCPPSVRWSEAFPDTSNAAAEEGTGAHALAEKKLRARLKTGRRQRFKEDDEVMQEATDNYRDYVIGLVNELQGMNAEPDLNIEVQLDLSDWVPEGFGTSDACIPSTKTLHIIDLKYGKGISVDAAENSQMRLYALGAVALFWPIYEFDTVKMHIYQPRLDNISVEEMSVDDLLKWGEGIKPIARLAFDGKGEAKAGDWCGFCPCKATCRTRAEAMFEALEAQPASNTLSLEEIAAYLPKLDGALKWAKDLQDYALKQAEAGERIPGYKLVEGRSNRKITKPSELAKELEVMGYTEDQIWKPKELQTLTALEKLVGPKAFKTGYADYIIKPKGKPVLVPENDKRPEMKGLTAEEMFTEIKEGENHAA